MKRFGCLLLTIACFASLFSNAQQTQGPSGADNIAYRWGKIALTCTGNDTDRFRPRPTVSSRFLGLIWTAVFDAWSRYDDKANPVYLKKVKRRSTAERTIRNKEIAISYAAYRTMLYYYFSDSVLLRESMYKLGLDPHNKTLNPDQPAGIGNLASKYVIEQRLLDGSNQTGTVEGSNGKAYSDYTGYHPVNTADSLTELKRWQPKYFSDGKGGQFVPDCLTPHWGKVKPMLLDDATIFRRVPPPAIGSPELIKDIKEVVELQANLSNEQKGLVEFMRDGPKSVQQAGHWLIFAQQVSVRDKHTLDEDVNMYFLVEAVAMDAFIACWDTKMFYDFARPYSLVHDYYKDQVIKLWGGPEEGFIQTTGQHWRPYSPETFLCPPFPSYVSGHSAVSAACAEVLRLYTGSDYFGETVKVAPGSMTELNFTGDSIILSFPTFTETANMAGMSRVIGGYHIQADNTEGLKLGRLVAAAAWKKFRYYRGETK